MANSKFEIKEIKKEISSSPPPSPVPKRARMARSCKMNVVYKMFFEEDEEDLSSKIKTKKFKPIKREIKIEEIDEEEPPFQPTGLVHTEDVQEKVSVNELGEEFAIVIENELNEGIPPTGHGSFTANEQGGGTLIANEQDDGILAVGHGNTAAELVAAEGLVSLATNPFYLPIPPLPIQFTIAELEKFYRSYNNSLKKASSSHN